jgi:hypothetical protein
VREIDDSGTVGALVQRRLEKEPLMWSAWMVPPPRGPA